MRVHRAGVWTGNFPIHTPITRRTHHLRRAGRGQLLMANCAYILNMPSRVCGIGALRAAEKAVARLLAVMSYPVISMSIAEMMAEPCGRAEPMTVPNNLRRTAANSCVRR